MVVGRPGMEQWPLIGPLGVSGRPSLGSAPLTPQGEGSIKGDLKIACSNSHGRVAELVVATPFCSVRHTDQFKK